MSCSSIPGLQPSQSGGFAASPEPWQELQVARAASRDAEERCQGVVTQLLAAGVQGGAEELLLLLLEPARTSKGVTSSSCDVLGRDGTPGVTSHLAASSPPFPVPSGPCAPAILGFLRGSDLITSPLHSEPGIKVWLPCIWGGDSPCEQLQTAANSCKQLQTAADSCRQPTARRRLQTLRGATGKRKWQQFQEPVPFAFCAPSTSHPSVSPDVQGLFGFGGFFCVFAWFGFFSFLGLYF